MVSIFLHMINSNAVDTQWSRRYIVLALIMQNRIILRFQIVLVIITNNFLVDKINIVQNIIWRLQHAYIRYAQDCTSLVSSILNIYNIEYWVPWCFFCVTVCCVSATGTWTKCSCGVYWWCFWSLPRWPCWGTTN